ncbi:MAG: phosphoglucosamine mutase, partial [Ignavibacteriae bacterium]
YCDGTGQFPHTPEPVPENLGDLARAVVEHHAVFGVAVDPDADRLVLIDETGTPIGEERTVALAAQAVYEAGGKGPAVVNYSTSRTIDDVAAHYGAVTYRSAVGEINVVRKMQELHAVIGGEGSGGVIYPTCHAGRDSIVGLALISSLLRTRGLSMREAVDALPHYSMLKSKVTLADRDRVAPTLERCAALFHDAVISREDGVHASWPDRWVHIRASNTEPIMRIIAEAPTPAEAAALVHRITAVLDATS